MPFPQLVRAVPRADNPVPDQFYCRQWLLAISRVDVCCNSHFQSVRRRQKSEQQNSHSEIIFSQNSCRRRPILEIKSSAWQCPFLLTCEADCAWKKNQDCSRDVSCLLQQENGNFRSFREKHFACGGFIFFSMEGWRVLSFWKPNPNWDCSKNGSFFHLFSTVRCGNNDTTGNTMAAICPTFGSKWSQECSGLGGSGTMKKQVIFLLAFVQWFLRNLNWLSWKLWTVQIKIEI